MLFLSTARGVATSRIAEISGVPLIALCVDGVTQHLARQLDAIASTRSDPVQFNEAKCRESGNMLVVARR
jgi:hypothetical protein